MYAAVPRITPAAVPRAVSVGEYEIDGDETVASLSKIFARPKSRSFTRPSGVIFTFAGLRSRWTIPFSCAASSASAICRAKERDSSSGRETGGDLLIEAVALDELHDEEVAR